MRKVALIKLRDKTVYGGDHDDITIRIVQHITDWAEIDDVDYVELYQAARKHDYVIVELPQYPQQEFIAQTIAEFREFAKKEAAKEAARAAKYKLENKARLAKNKANQIKRLKDKLEALGVGS